jgi:hypothetical protein
MAPFVDVFLTPFLFRREGCHAEAEGLIQRTREGGVNGSRKIILE